MTTRRLLIATFCFGVAFAAMRIETREPYGITLAGLALSYGALALLVDSSLARSERAIFVLMTSVMVGSMIVIGLVFAILGR